MPTLHTLLLTIPEVAEELRLSRPTIYRKIGRGELQVVDVAAPGSTKTQFRVPRASLTAYIERRLSSKSASAA